jgi:galactose mutarotase-like enzyme
MITLSSDKLSARLSPIGAELKSLLETATGRELIWPGNAEYWNRSSPVLFPIVGKLRNNTYSFGGKQYQLTQHGFARDLPFTIIEQSGNRILFRLESDPTTLEKYPFPFILDIEYVLTGTTLHVHYRVENPARNDMYFSLGAHPAFYCAAVQDKTEVKATMRLPLSQELLVYRLKDGLVQKEATEGLMASLEARIDLTDELIENDAMIFKRSIGPWIDLYVPGRTGRLRFTAKGWPYFGIWSKKGSPFVCLEPWYGLADSEGAEDDFTHKEGIITLAGGKSWKATWSVELKA